MAQLNSLTTRELAKLGADFASVNITNSHVTCSKCRNASQTPDQTEWSWLLPLQIENNDQGPIPGAAVSLNLHSLIL